MKYLIKFFAIIGLVSMSHVAVAVDSVTTGDLLTADTMNAHIDTTNANTKAVEEINDAVITLEANSADFDFDVTLPPGPPCGIGGNVYSVGDMGPAGGWVFITDAGGCNGLEAWTVDEVSVTIKWGCVGTNIAGAAGIAIGTGAPNTLDVVNAGCAPAGDAVPLTRAAVYGGMTDWYLPSRGELLEMYDTIGPGGSGAGMFVGGPYWSSTEVDADRASQVNFANRNAGAVQKDFHRAVRAIRTFNQP